MVLQSTAVLEEGDREEEFDVPSIILENLAVLVMKGTAVDFGLACKSSLFFSC
jgi:hypothetical protein